MVSTLMSSLFVTSLLAGSQIEWRCSFEEAQAEARREGKVVFIAVNMDGERANDEMVSVHYRDPRIVRLTRSVVPIFCSKETHRSSGVCPRAGRCTCADHQANEKEVRRRYLALDADAAVVAPQHLFLSPEGEVLLSVPYRITVGELEWCLVEAIRSVDPEFRHTLSPEARPPRRLARERVEVEAPPVERAPTKKEIEEILARLRGAAGGREDGEREGRRRLIERLLFSDDRKVLDFVEAQLRSKWAGRSAEGGQAAWLLHRIGVHGSPAWRKVVEPFLDDHRPRVRREAAVALEQIGDPAAAGALRKRLRKEEDPAVRGDLLRALAVLAPSDRKVAAAVEKAASRSDDPGERADAVVAAAFLGDREVARGVILAALDDEAAVVRAAAAVAAALAREEDLRPEIERRALLEQDGRAKAVIERALEVLGGRPAGDLVERLGPLGASDIPRDRR